MLGPTLLLSAGVFGACAFGALGLASRPDPLRRAFGAGEPERRAGFLRQTEALLRSRKALLAAAAGAALAGWVRAGRGCGAAAGGVRVPAAATGARRLQEKAMRRAVVSGLEGACTVIATALRSGQDLVSALEAAVRYARSPLREELGEVLAGARLGRPLSEVFAEFAGRWPSPETRLLAFAFDLASKLGGSAVPQTRLSVTESVRERFQQEHLVRAKTAYQRISGVIVSLVPVWCLCWMWFLSPGMVGSLLSPEGRIWLLLGVVLLAAGWAAVYFVMRVEEF